MYSSIRHSYAIGSGADGVLPHRASRQLIGHFWSKQSDLKQAMFPHVISAMSHQFVSSSEATTKLCYFALNTVTVKNDFCLGDHHVLSVNRPTSELQVVCDLRAGSVGLDRPGQMYTVFMGPFIQNTVVELYSL